MGFFTDLKEDLAMAVNELMPEETEDVIRTAEDSVDVSGQEVTEAGAEDNILVSAEDFELDKMLENLEALELQMPQDEIEEAVIEEVVEAENEEGVIEEVVEAENEEELIEELVETEIEEAVIEEVVEAENEEDVIEEVVEAENEEDVIEEVAEAEIEEVLIEEFFIEEELEDIDKILNAEVEVAGAFIDEITTEVEAEIEEVIEEVVEPQSEETVILAAVEQEEKNTQDEGTEKKMETMTNRVASDETAVITQGMVITGDIISEGSVDVIGAINGNIDILGKLNVTGSIQGNSKASEIFADNAKINGEIIAEGSVKIGQSSIIIGNINASSAVIAGAVKGDIDVQGPVILDTSAIVMGNIKSKFVQINNGAVIEGMCSQCYADVNPTSFFDELKKNK